MAKNRLKDVPGEIKTESENKGAVCLFAFVTVHVRVCWYVSGYAPIFIFKSTSESW